VQTFLAPTHLRIKVSHEIDGVWDKMFDSSWNPITKAAGKMAVKQLSFNSAKSKTALSVPYIAFNNNNKVLRVTFSTNAFNTA